ncbi:MAG: AAA family ATPase [Prevotellaceae bacterium]|jgi:predicted AAA+ superfamily ATPase|nr:AAA family ATPase [Prevotellaceae bacterium]
MGDLIFKRKLYDRMLRWKRESGGKTALLIRGARRVGKSTLAEEFARSEYKFRLNIDFSNASSDVNDLFNDISDLNLFFFRLQAFYNVSLEERQSVIIFDEVQLQPKARQAIKHLVKDGRYDYIETGSLLSIKRNVRNIVIPSEETRVNLYPMDYEEFRWALGDETTLDMLRAALAKKMSLSDALNRKLMRDFRLYMLVGGMPQAVLEYLNTNNLAMVDNVKRNILELYDDDFHKIDARGRTSLLFKAIPSELNRNASRYSVGNVIDGVRSERMYETIGEMIDSMTVNVAYHANDPAVGMALHKDVRRYKLYAGDTGLFVTLAFFDRDYVDNKLYSKLLSDKLSVDLGYVYENVVAQMFRAAGNELYYYTFPKENSNHNCEIDFLLSREDKICPVEVKSSGYKTHASLDAFSLKFSSRILRQYLLYTKDLRKEGNVLYLPVYMAGLI